MTRDELVGYLATLGVDPAIDDRASLVEGGWLDSILLLSVFEFLRREAGVIIEPADVTLDNFDTVERILAFVNRGP